MKGVFAKLLNKNPNHDFQESDFKELTKNAPSCFRYATDELSFYQNIREPKTRARIRHQSYGGFFNTADQRIIEDITPSPDFQM